MYHNPTQLDSFNKYPPGKAQGTLIANWFEERELRTHEGYGRAVTQTHVPKMHHTLLHAEPGEISKM